MPESRAVGTPRLRVPTKYPPTQRAGTSPSEPARRIRLNDAGEPVPHEVRAREREERVPGEPLPDVPAPDVSELVREDDRDLAVCEAAVEERVEEEDARRGPDPGRERVHLVGLALHLEDVDGRARDA